MEQESRKLKLVVYNVPDTADDEDEFLKPIVKHVQPLLSKEFRIGETNWARIGYFSSHQRKPRPLLVSFDTLDGKHSFLKNAKALRQKGIRCDDDLTRLQQQEEKQLSEDFQVLKAKGHKPFFRGSHLKYHWADETYNCKLGQAQRAPAVIVA